MPEPAQFSVGGPRARGTAPLAEPAESVVLHPEQSASRFDHQHHPVPAGLDDFVLNFWTVTWSVDEPYTAKVLPLPTVHATVTNTECDVTGLVRGRYDRHLTGTGYGVGARFRPGCVRAFIDRPVAEQPQPPPPLSSAPPAPPSEAPSVVSSPVVAGGSVPLEPSEALPDASTPVSSPG